MPYNKDYKRQKNQKTRKQKEKTRQKQAWPWTTQSITDTNPIYHRYQQMINISKLDLFLQLPVTVPVNLIDKWRIRKTIQAMTSRTRAGGVELMKYRETEDA